MSTPMAETTSAPSLREAETALHELCVAVASTHDAQMKAIREFHFAYDADRDVPGATRASQAAQERHTRAVGELVSAARRYAAAPPTTLTEAVASARAEGVREGLERAAALHETVEIARLCALLTEAVWALQPFAGAAAEEHMRFVKNEQRLFLETMAEVCITRDIRGGDLRRARSALENLTSGLALTAQEQMEKLAKELGTSGTAETFRAALAVAKQAASEARATLTPGGRTDG